MSVEGIEFLRLGVTGHFIGGLKDFLLFATNIFLTRKQKSGGTDPQKKPTDDLQFHTCMFGVIKSESYSSQGWITNKAMRTIRMNSLERRCLNINNFFFRNEI